MGYGQRGRPRAEGERYPSGKLKPAVQIPIDPAREPISGATVQRMLSADVRRYREADYGKEATRLWMDGRLTANEISTGLRFAAIYGRFEFYNGLSRSAAGPHYIREYISEGVVMDSDQLRRADSPDERERRVREADAAFKSLGGVLSFEYRSALEALFVDDRHIGYHLHKAKIALAVLAEYFRELEKGGPSKRDRKKKNKLRSAMVAPAVPKVDNVNPFKKAFFLVRRKRSPTLSDQDLEVEWNTMHAVKSLEDFRREKAEA